MSSRSQSVRGDPGGNVEPMPFTEHWKEQVDARLDALEKKQAAMDAVIASARWLIPLLMGLAGVLIGKFA